MKIKYQMFMESHPVIINSVCELCGADIHKEGDNFWEWTYTDDAGTQFHFPFCGDSMEYHRPNEVLMVQRILESYE
jgi:hypothetical protein